MLVARKLRELDSFGRDFHCDVCVDRAERVAQVGKQPESLRSVRGEQVAGPLKQRSAAAESARSRAVRPAVPRCTAARAVERAPGVIDRAELRSVGERLVEVRWPATSSSSTRLRGVPRASRPDVLGFGAGCLGSAS